MRNVMVKAWQIARKGQSKFGGKVKEYFAEALKIAWAIVKNTMTNYASKIKGTLKTLNLPTLNGSDKQIEWANKIRENAIETMTNDVMTEEYTIKALMPNSKPTVQKRDVRPLVNALVSKEKIQAYFEELEKQDLPQERIENTVKTMNAAYDRFIRFFEIATNNSAKFWIDNRDNQEKNYMFKEFSNYVNTGTKNF